MKDQKAMVASSLLSLSHKTDPSIKYSELEVLGEGSFSVVYKGKSIFSNEEYAIKVFPCEVDADIVVDATEETAILKNLRSPCLVTFHESYIYHGEMWLITECCRGGSVADFVGIMNFQVCRRISMFYS